uniref:Uncharacterized protein n=1 Tax=Anopheles merus TaxID=30066 RepID=A0A2C9H5U6_ANOME
MEPIDTLSYGHNSGRGQTIFLPLLKSHYLLLWSFCTIFLPSAHAALRNVVIMEKVEIFDTPTLRTTANITQHSPASVPAVFVEMVALQDISQLKINSVFTVRSRTGELQAALYNSTLGLCEFLEHPFRNRLLQIIQLELIRHSNIPTKCPMRAGLYYIRNVSFARARIPSFLPASYFRVDVNLLKTKPWQTVLETRWYGKLIKK